MRMSLTEEELSMNSQGWMGVSNRSGYPVVLIAAVCLMLVAVSAFGQLPTGTILGTVTDSTGAVVPGANVIVKSVDTGSTRPVPTGNNGVYRAQALLVGNYEVSVPKGGFQTASRTGVNL